MKTALGIFPHSTVAINFSIRNRELSENLTIVPRGLPVARPGRLVPILNSRSLPDITTTADVTTLKSFTGVSSQGLNVRNIMLRIKRGEGRKRPYGYGVAHAQSAFALKAQDALSIAPARYSFGKPFATSSTM